MSVWVCLEIVGRREPLRYDALVRALGRVEGLRLAQRPLSARNPMTGEPIEIPLREPVRVVECRAPQGEWYHALEFVPLDRDAPITAQTEGLIVGTDHFYPLTSTDPVIQELADVLDAEARAAVWKL